MKRIGLILCLFTCCKAFSQSKVQDALQQYRRDYLPEKVFVHTDKNIYAAGETLWMALYLVDGQSHKPGAFSTFVTLDLVDEQQQLIGHAKVFAPEGYASASLDIPIEVKPGTYQLIAYTNYQRNSGLEGIFRKSIQIVKGLHKPPVQVGTDQTIEDQDISLGPKLRFFPEGGDCVVGLPCNVAITAEGGNGLPALAQGIVRPQGEAPIALFKTNVNGFGQFTFVPQPGKKYVAQLGDSPEDTSFLPEPIPQGYNLNVRHMKEEVQIVLRSTLLAGLQGAQVVVHHRGLPFLDEQLFTTAGATLLKIPYAEMGAGVHVVTLFDREGFPVAERLFFVAPQSETSPVKLDLQQADISPNQKVGLQVSIPSVDQLHDSLSHAQLSLSILPLPANVPMDGEDMRTWLLLNSDLDLPVPFAAPLLTGSEGQAQNVVLDQYLLTRAWRRFRWESLLSNPSFDPEYPLDRGIFIRGQMTKQDAPGEPRPGKVFLNQMSEGFFDETLTDEQGNFVFGPFLLFDTTEFILQGRFKLGKKKKARENISMDDNSNAMLQLREVENTLAIKPAAHLGDISPESPSVRAYEKLSRDKLLLDTYGEILEVELPEVVINDTRKDPQRRAMYAGNPSFRMVLDSIPGARNLTSIIDLFYRLPGVQILGGKIYVQGPTDLFDYQDVEPTYMLDRMETDLGTLSSVPVRDIDFIDILKGSDATTFGVRGANGVILVYTRPGYNSNLNASPGILTAKIAGFHKVREFAPYDERASQNENWKDIRTTLHWNPKLEISPRENITETFSTSDQTGTFVVVVQGLRKNGEVLVGTTSFEVVAQ